MAIPRSKTKTKKGQTMGNQQKEIGIDEANCTALSIHAPVEMLKKNGNDPSGPVTGFLIEAYTGAVVERWWGKLAIDVSGISARQQIPIFLNHDPDKIVGFSKDTRKDTSFWVEGKFSEVTEESKKARALAAEGFPWQASIGVQAKKVMSLEANTTMAVNGIDVTGPAEVWLESEVFETSFVPVGADNNTGIHTFSRFQEKEMPEHRQYAIDHPEEDHKSYNRDESQTGALNNNHHKGEHFMELTLEKLKADAPDLLSQIQTAAADEARKEGLKEGLTQGAEIERKRIQEVMAQDMPGHEGLIQKLAFDGKTTGPEAAVQILAAERQIRKVAQENLSADAIDPVSTPAADPTQSTQPKTVTAENFSQHKDLVEEFNGSFEMYEAYQDALKKHKINILGGKR